jgi:hypothetical protein
VPSWAFIGARSAISYVGLASTCATAVRDQGLTWNEVAEQVDMTTSGVWSRYRRARSPKPPRLGRWQQVLVDALDKNLAIGVRAAVADHLGRAPTRAELTAARRAAHSLAASGRAPERLICQARMPTTVQAIALSGAGEAGCDHERHPVHAPRYTETSIRAQHPSLCFTAKGNAIASGSSFV